MNGGWIGFEPGALSVVESFTFAFLYKPEASGEAFNKCLMSTGNASKTAFGTRAAFWSRREETDKAHFSRGVTTFSELTAKADVSHWLLLVVTKEKGETKPKAYLYDFTSEEFTSAEGSVKIAASEAAGYYRVGIYSTIFGASCAFAAIAGWNGTVLSEGEAKALHEVSSLDQWLEKGVSALWFFNQKEVTEEIKDRTESGANQNSREGTKVKEAEPPIPYFGPKDGTAKGIVEIAGISEGKAPINGTGNGTVEIIGAASGEALSTLDGETNGLLEVLGLADGERIAEAEGVGLVEVIGVTDGEAVPAKEGETLGIVEIVGVAEGRAAHTLDGTANGELTIEGFGRGENPIFHPAPRGSQIIYQQRQVP